MNYTIQPLKSKLLELGYLANIANGDCFDIVQDGRVHYLSLGEANQLANAELGLAHPVRLFDYAEKIGSNYWYEFDVEVK